MLKVRNIFIFIFSYCVFLNANASPSYSLEMQGGFFYSADETWPEYYGGKSTPEIGFSISRRFFNVLDVGTSMSFSQTEGTAGFPISPIRSGKVYHKTMPLEFFALLRGRFSNKQWFVPYIGGGYTRLFYQQILNNVTSARGSINALHARAGLQFLLDPLDPESAKTMLKTYGVLNSYLFLEGKVLKADIHASTGTASIDLGGTSYRLGVMLEY